MKIREAIGYIIGGLVTFVLAWTYCGGGHAAVEAVKYPRLSFGVANSHAPVNVPPQEFDSTKVVVHVVGAVKNPGVYTLNRAARVVTAVNAAGGTTKDADTSMINMARRLEDGEQVRIPSNRPQEAVMGSAPVMSFSSVASGQKVIAKVNINKAGVQELDTLPGIGPALAQRIINYRNSVGRFNSPNELVNVSGIGEKKLAEILPHVTL
ncbi:MAG: helix-hairpin-helix domain-containing protein [Abditibacteriota bacterium]|nr:helix-hairpin-helix domain-containing protein [Abditibacteriota bacterium]